MMRLNRFMAERYRTISRIDPPYRRAIIRSALHGFAGLATALLLWPNVNEAILLGWLTLLASTLFFTQKIEMLPSYSVVLRSVAALMASLTWCIPLFLATADLEVPLWAISATLIGTSAALLPGNPRSTYMLSAVLGLLYAASFLVSDDTDLAVVALIFSTAIIVGAAQNAKRLRTAADTKMALREKEEVVALLLREFEEGDADWLWQIDGAQRIRSASSRFAFALGMTAQEIENKLLIELLAGAGCDQQVNATLLNLKTRLVTREPFSNLPVRVMVTDEPRWWQLSGSPRRDAAGHFTGFHGVASDITAQRERSDKIAYLARHDTLTGLPNRSLLSENLAEALLHATQAGTQCAFLMIDLDRFKAVNDTLGHPIGDQLLVLLSQRLQAEMQGGQLCCRMGGDEFAVIVPMPCEAAHIHQLANRIIERLSQPYSIGPHSLCIGASVGSALGPHNGATVETLTHNADLALYRAKGIGGNAHVAYDYTLHMQAVERRRIEADLRNALGAGELDVHYQPVVDAKTETVVSLEALLRWNSAERGPVSPSQFLRIAEDTRLVIPIGEWVLRRACLEAAKWPSGIRVAVNVSAGQLLDQNFPDMVVSALTMSGLAPQRLEIEVNESIFVRDEALAQSALDHIIALGCTIALDDFGTGQSSLSYLRELCFSAIKIDRSFVQGATQGNAESLAVIRAVVAVAESLEMSTTAEGVETQTELDVMRQLGCRLAQGFQFGKPMPAEAVSQLFKARQIGAL